MCISGTRFGVGQHIWAVDEGDYVMSSKIMAAVIITYHAAITATKTTFLLQYRRVFPLPRFQRLCDVVMAFVLLFGTSQVISSGLRCVPLSNAWDPEHHGGNCVNLVVWWHVNSGVNLATDIIILLMPIPLLVKLPLPRKQRVILIGIFGLGIL